MTCSLCGRKPSWCECTQEAYELADLKDEVANMRNEIEEKEKENEEALERLNKLNRDRDRFKLRAQMASRQAAALLSTQRYRYEDHGSLVLTAVRITDLLLAELEKGKA